MSDKVSGELCFRQAGGIARTSCMIETILSKEHSCCIITHVNVLLAQNIAIKHQTQREEIMIIYYQTF